MDNNQTEHTAQPATVSDTETPQKRRKKPSRRTPTRTKTERVKRINEKHTRELADEGHIQEREAIKAAKVIATHTVSWLLDSTYEERLAFLANIEDYASIAELRMLHASAYFAADDED